MTNLDVNAAATRRAELAVAKAAERVVDEDAHAWQKIQSNAVRAGKTEDHREDAYVATIGDNPNYVGINALEDNGVFLQLMAYTDVLGGISFSEEEAFALHAELTRILFS